MRKKPDLNHAEIIDTVVTITPEMMKLMTPEAIEILNVMGNKEM